MQEPELKVTPLRCPTAILRRMDYLSVVSRHSRASLMVSAVRLFVSQAKKRDSKIIPPYSQAFAEDELQFIRDRIAHQKSKESDKSKGR